MYKNPKQLLLLDLILAIIIFFISILFYKTTSLFALGLMGNAIMFILIGFVFSFFIKEKQLYSKIRVLFLNSLIFSFLFEIIESIYFYFNDHYSREAGFGYLLKSFIIFWIIIFLLNFFGSIIGAIFKKILNPKS
jgi:hypothetical protein